MSANMTSKINTRLTNAEMTLKTQESQIQNKIRRMQTKQTKETKELLKLMKLGDEDMINGQAELIADIQGNIRDLTRTKQRLHIFASKINTARTQQSIGAGMVAVSQALGQVAKTIELEKIETIMQDLGKHFDDIQVMTQVLDSATETNTAATISPEAVELVKRQVADAHGIQLSQDLNTAAVNVNSQLSAPVKVGPTPEEEEESSERLKALRLKA